MATLPDLLNRFAHFLDASWAAMKPAFEDDETSTLQIDWLQANWEIIVEGGLLPQRVALRPYGDGADCNGASSRVLFPEKTEPHRIVLKAKQRHLLFDHLGKSQIDPAQKTLVFDRFVSQGSDGWYYECRPFTHILAENEDEWVLISKNDARVRLEPTRFRTS